MPTASHLKVLVSGVSGFLAAWIVRTLLERGYHVRGTVRSTEKGDYLQRLFEEHGDRFEYVIAQDVAKEGAFDDAVKGMGGVIHTASPFHMKADDPQEIIEPALKGTISILESILKFGHSVRRVVFTSSTVAIHDFTPPFEPFRSDIFTEKDWNLDSTILVEKQGRDAPQFHKYRASKVAAERAAWEFVDKHKAKIGWDLVTLQPPWIFGPLIHDVSSESSLNTSSALFLGFLKNDPPRSTADLADPADNYVDVRDLAWAHAEALNNDQVANQSKDAAFNEGKGRLALSAQSFTWQDVADAIGASSGTFPKMTPRGEPGAGKKTVHPVVVDSSRARNLLGLKFRSSNETFVDTFESLKGKGWVS